MTGRGLVAVGGALALAGALAGCGGSGHKASAPTTAATIPATSVSSSTSTTSAPTTVPAPTTTVFGEGIVGAQVGPTGTTLVPPSAPTVVAYNPSCQVLLDPGFNGTCVIIAAPSGTIAGLVEYTSSSGGASQERDLVWHEVGSTWQLALRRSVTGPSNNSQVEGSDIQRDGDPKIVFTTPSPNPQYADELDVVEGNGTVSLYRELHGGFATVAPAGGLETFTPSAAPATGYDEATITYTGGAWRITADAQVSQTQGSADNGESGFSDPHGIQATYLQ